MLFLISPKNTAKKIFLNKYLWKYKITSSRSIPVNKITWLERMNTLRVLKYIAKILPRKFICLYPFLLLPPSNSVWECYFTTLSKDSGQIAWCTGILSPPPPAPPPQINHRKTGFCISQFPQGWKIKMRPESTILCSTHFSCKNTYPVYTIHVVLESGICPQLEKKESFILAAWRTADGPQMPEKCHKATCVGLD